MDSTDTLKDIDIYELDKKHHLSIRVMNSCLNTGLVTLYAILNYYFKNGNFTYLRRCGVKCNAELIDLCQYYITKYNIEKNELEINQIDQQFNEFKVFAHSNFGLNSDVTESFRDCYTHNSFHLFSFIINILERSLNEKELFIFQHNYGFIQGYKKVSYQDIGESFGLTRERARQIYKALPRILSRIIIKLKKSNLPIDSFIHQYDDNNNLPNYYKIDDDFANKVNAKEGTNVSAKFCCYVLSTLSEKNYRMIQSIESDYNCYYAINKTYYDKVKLDMIFTHFERVNERRRPTDIIIKIEDLITTHLNYSDSNISSNQVLKSFLIDVSNSCFNFKHEKNYFIIAPRNTLTKISEHIVQILKNNGNPMTLLEIHKCISETTDKKPTIESLRSSILNTPSVVAIGKTSTYALSEWSNVNTKKIKDIVYDLLVQNPEKSYTINEVTDYVCQFRDTNSKNIRTNLKLDQTGRFKFDEVNRISLGKVES